MKEPEIIDDAGGFLLCTRLGICQKGMDSGRYTEPSKIFFSLRRSTGGMCLQRSAILMKIILRIWRISISVIVQGYLGIRTAIARMRSFTMREAAQADRDTTRSRWISPLATVFI